MNGANFARGKLGLPPAMGKIGPAQSPISPFAAWNSLKFIMAWHFYCFVPSNRRQNERGKVVGIFTAVDGLRVLSDALKAPVPARRKGAKK